MKSSNENINLDSKSLNSFSDEETSNGSTMKKYKSAEDIEIGSYTGWRIIEYCCYNDDIYFQLFQPYVKSL